MRRSRWARPRSRCGCAADRADRLTPSLGVPRGACRGPGSCATAPRPAPTRASGAPRGVCRWSNGGVPWCLTCDRFLSPSTVRPDGACPTCGMPVDPGRARPATDRGRAGPAVGGTCEPRALNGGARPADDPGTPARGDGPLTPASATSASATSASATSASATSASATRGPAPEGVLSGARAEDGGPVPVPWHLKVLVGAVAVYLGYRAFQGIEWLIGRV